MVWVGKGLKSHLIANPCHGETPSNRPGCSESHPDRLRILPVNVKQLTDLSWHSMTNGVCNFPASMRAARGWMVSGNAGAAFVLPPGAQELGLWFVCARPRLHLIIDWGLSHWLLTHLTSALPPADPHWHLQELGSGS